MSGLRALAREWGRRGRALLDHAGWGLAIAWRASAPVLVGVLVVAALRALFPAGLALVARAIVNAAVGSVRAGSIDFAPLLPWLGFGFALTLFEGLCGHAAVLLRNRLRDLLVGRMTADVLAHAAGLELADVEAPQTQDILQRAKDNPGAHLHAMLIDCIGAASHALQIASMLAILVVIEPWLVAALLLCTVPYLRAQWRLASMQHALERSRATARRWTTYYLTLLTTPASAGEVQLLRLAPTLVTRFRALMDRFATQDWALAQRAFRGSAGFVLLTTAVVYAAFAHVAWRALHGAVTIGDLAIFGAASARLRMTLEGFVALCSTALRETLYLTDLRAFLALPSRPALPAGGDAAAEDVAPAGRATARGALELRGVTFTYPGAGAPALRDVTLHIAPGETVALVGENGAGKSTLVKLIAGLYEPDAGSVLLNGTALRDWPRAAAQQRMAVVFQGFGRFEASAADNIAFGDWERLRETRDGVAAVAEATGLDALVATLPRGYDTTLGPLFGERDLSAGQWQTFAVARAAARDADVLILDEPTAHLDARAEHALFEQFRALASGRTTIIVSHRFSTVSMAQRIVVLDGGRIVESGTHAELLARAGQYAMLYGLAERTRLRAVS